MIYVIEGPDGTGKSTLAEALAKKVHGTIVHPTYDKKWDMYEYHEAFMDFAEGLHTCEIPVILDRWAPSEYVYGKVFRRGPSFDVEGMIEEYKRWNTPIVWIYCRNDNAVENHLKNMKKREEMFDDMTQVVKEFDAYVEVTSLGGRQWHVFDFDKTDTKEFIKGLPR